MFSIPARKAASLKNPWSMATSKHLPSAAKSRFIRGLASMMGRKRGKVTKGGRPGLYTNRANDGRAKKTSLLGIAGRMAFWLCPEGTIGLSLGFNPGYG